jgi:multiple sugar transport system substrate-binding protein
MKKNINSKIAFLAIALLSLVGCQDGQGDNIVSFWAYQPSTQTHQNSFRALISDFTEETGIKVKLNLVVKDSFNMALNSALSGRSKPDMSYLDQPLISDYASDGTIYDITSMFNGFSSVEQEDFFPSVFSTNVYDSKLYGLPLNVTASVLFYNKSLVENRLRHGRNGSLAATIFRLASHYLTELAMAVMPVGTFRSF